MMTILANSSSLNFIAQQFCKADVYVENTTSSFCIFRHYSLSDYGHNFTD